MCDYLPPFPLCIACDKTRDNGILFSPKKDRNSDISYSTDDLEDIRLREILISRSQKDKYCCDFIYINYVVAGGRRMESYYLMGTEV